MRIFCVSIVQLLLGAGTKRFYARQLRCFIPVSFSKLSLLFWLKCLYNARNIASSPFFVLGKDCKTHNVTFLTVSFFTLSNGVKSSVVIQLLLGVISPFGLFSFTAGLFWSET